MPRLLGVQAVGASPIVRAFHARADLVASGSDTIADSIAVGTPRNWRRALAWIRASRGSMVAVPDDGILDAMRVTARLAGVFGEPAGVAGVAGLRTAVAQGVIPPDARVLVVVTGNGLKDIRTAAQAAGRPHDIRPDPDDVDAIMRR
jgi:threonine synthase